MNCQAVRERILVADDPQAPGAESSFHLQGCTDCQAFAKRVIAIEKAVTALPTPGDTEVAREAVMARVRAELNQAVRKARPMQFSPVRRWYGRPAWGLVAAVLVVGIGIGLHLRHASVASAAVMDQLVDWNLDLADAGAPQDRQQLYTARAASLDAAVRQASFSSDERQLAALLLEQGSWLAKNSDPADEAEHFSELADQIANRLDKAVVANDSPAVQRLGRNYDRVVQRGVKPKMQRLGAPAFVSKPDGAKRYDRLVKRQAERDRRLQILAEKHPKAAAKLQMNRAKEGPRRPGDATF